MKNTAERYEKWEPVKGIVTPVASALIAEDHEGLQVTLLFSEIVDGGDSDLSLKFGRVLAYTVYEELLHPWEFSEAPPTLEWKSQTYTYPLLQIQNSRWIASIPNFSFVYPDATHYRLLTLDQVADVLCSRLPEVNWLHDG